MPGPEIEKIETWAERPIKPISKIGMAIRIGLATAALATVQNTAEIERFQSWDDNGIMVPTIPGCDIEPELELGQIPQLSDAHDHNGAEQVEHTLGVNGVESSATRDVVNDRDLDILETVRQIRNGFNHPQSTFTSEYSGVRFAFYSDASTAQWEIDEEAFDEVFHYGLTVDPGYDEPVINDTLDCLRQRILVDQEFAGQEYQIHIPNNIQSCLGSLRVINFDKYTRSLCRQMGVTPPKFQIQFLWWKPISENVMVLTGGRGANSENISDRMSRLVMHEAMHAYLTLTDTPLRLDPDEKWVQFQEEALMESLDGLPSVIRYPQRNEPPNILSIGN